MEQSRIDRISELTRLSRTRPLTQAEQTERRALREEYIASVRASLETELENTFIVEPDGTKRPVSRKHV